MKRLGALLLVLVLFTVGCAKRTTPPPTQHTVTVYRPSGTTYTEGSMTTVMTQGTATTDMTGTGTDTTGTGTGTGTTVAGGTAAGTTTATTVVAGQVTTTTQPTTTHTTYKPVTLPAEMRAAWVSYIELNELFSKYKTPNEAKDAIDNLMVKLGMWHINTVFFHVRANSDAYYASDIFAPAAVVKPLLEAGFDPLEYAVKSARSRGIAFHAWVNPYRIGKDASYAVTGIPTMSDASGRLYYVPTSASAQLLILEGVHELMSKYPIDGIQYDDYFYPSDLLKEDVVADFESADYTKYTSDGGKLSVGDWRRANVDALIFSTYTIVDNEDRIFGVSPAANADNTYKSLYADPLRWLREPGYVHYLCPQIYTGFEHGTQPFDAVLAKWQGYERDASVQLYVGVALYKIGLKNDTYAGAGKTEWTNHTNIMQRSVRLLRDKGIRGIGFYSYSFFEPENKKGLTETNDLAVAKAEVKNLLDIL